jgi:hypothetical protein
MADSARSESLASMRATIIPRGASPTPNHLLSLHRNLIALTVLDDLPGFAINTSFE